jgi:AcrR family transcriptional regulator
MPRPSRRCQLLAAARGLFLRHGYQGTSLRAIAKASGLTMGAVYHHFRSKEDLYLAVLCDHDLPRHLEGISTLLASPSFPDNLAEVGRVIWQAARDNKDFFKLAYVDILEFGGRNVKPLVQGMRGATAVFAQDLLQKRIDRGELAPLHLHVILRCLTDTFLHYYLEEMMLEKSLASETGLTDEEVARQLAQILLRGMRR